LKLKKDLKDLREWSKLFLKDAENDIKELLNKEWIKNYKIDYRVKSIYSIYKKIQKKWLSDAKSLYDIFGIRIVVNNVEECYKTLWLLHNKWSPLPSRFKDYIALPKPNWYKALHTTIVGLLNKNKRQPAEIQIKTSEMMEYAEIWVAAHFEYKEKW
jgi:GTP pyrophosphokinase